ncbi:hypothetical protein CEP53_002951 [Fusarium sp. AF-6]|nr:hypothetical protein CEP53_002951 [Fusarium sp. AF-6]
MSGTAPSDPSPGSHARGVEQTPSDANQHGQAQNIIDETKDTCGPTTVDASIGYMIDAGDGEAALSNRLEDMANQPKVKGGSAGTERKAATLDKRGFKVGEKADLHDLAQQKQP